MELVPPPGPVAPSVSAGDAFRMSCQGLCELLKTAKWNKKTRPTRMMSALHGLSRHPFKHDMIYQDLPLYFTGIREALEGVLALIVQTRWLPAQFHNVDNAMRWLHGVLMSMDLPKPSQENVDASESVQEHEFVRSGTGKECGPADWPEKFEGFDDPALEPETEGAESQGGAPPSH